MEKTSFGKENAVENVPKSSQRTIIKLLVLAVVVLSTLTLLTLTLKLHREQERNRALTSQAVAQEQEKSRLERYIEEKGTIQGIIRIAMEELGLVEPDNIIIQPE